MTDTVSTTAANADEVTERAAEPYAELVGGLRAEFRADAEARCS